MEYGLWCVVKTVKIFTNIEKRTEGEAFCCFYPFLFFLWRQKINGKSQSHVVLKCIDIHTRWDTHSNTHSHTLIQAHKELECNNLVEWNRWHDEEDESVLYERWKFQCIHGKWEFNVHPSVRMCVFSSLFPSSQSPFMVFNVWNALHYESRRVSLNGKLWHRHSIFIGGPRYDDDSCPWQDMFNHPIWIFHNKPSSFIYFKSHHNFYVTSSHGC